VPPAVHLRKRRSEIPLLYGEIKKVCSRNAPPHTKQPKFDPLFEKTATEAANTPKKVQMGRIDRAEAVYEVSRRLEVCGGGCVGLKGGWYRVGTG